MHVARGAAVRDRIGRQIEGTVPVVSRRVARVTRCIGGVTRPGAIGGSVAHVRARVARIRDRDVGGIAPIRRAVGRWRQRPAATPHGGGSGDDAQRGQDLAHASIIGGSWRR